MREISIKSGRYPRDLHGIRADQDNIHKYRQGIGTDRQRISTDQDRIKRYPYRIRGYLQDIQILILGTILMPGPAYKVWVQVVSRVSKLSALQWVCPLDAMLLTAGVIDLPPCVIA